ncbi:MAG: hypothetical protein K8F29_04040 [Kofleriaceae bacterium]|nr:hypothetical protein [Candidatus Methylomirabilis lanthanidiphila]
MPDESDDFQGECKKKPKLAVEVVQRFVVHGLKATHLHDDVGLRPGRSEVS